MKIYKLDRWFREVGSIKPTTIAYDEALSTCAYSESASN